MLLSMLTLRPAAGRRDDLVAWYRTSGVLEESGALSSQVLVGEDADDVVVTAFWADADGYRTWQDSPRRAEFGAQMAPFFDRSSTVGTQQFEVVHAWPGTAPGAG
jgi:heme-degrading monooxygenase HmoA